MPWMQTVLLILTGLAMLGVLATLFLGLFGFVAGNSSGARSNKLMQYRVLLQGAAIGLVVLLLFLQRQA
jgi:hypothetical protein